MTENPERQRRHVQMDTRHDKRSVKKSATPTRGKVGARGPASGRITHEVEVDEARERAESQEVLGLEPSDGVDEIGDELGQTYVENVTGADDASTEHRATETPADDGGPFVVTSGAVEFASGTDASNPAGAEREALPTVSASRPRKVR
jgi:hypothetical protein